MRKNNSGCTEVSVFKRIMGIFLFGIAAIFGNVISVIPWIASVPMALLYLGIQLRLWF